MTDSGGEKMSLGATELPFILDFTGMNGSKRVEEAVFAIGFRPERKMPNVRLSITRKETREINAEMAGVWDRSCFANTVTRPTRTTTVLHGEIKGVPFMAMLNVTSTYGILTTDMNRYGLLRWAEANDVSNSK